MDTQATSYEIQPLADSRWSEFVNRHPRSSVFHTVPWLEALHKTYGYKPIAFTTSPPGADLQNGLLFCYVNSWLTGRRLVSTPFSDHCEPLVDDPAVWSALFSLLERRMRQERLAYIEVRPKQQVFAGSTVLFHSTFLQCSHQLDLRPDLNTVFRSFHKDCTQRKIRRAEREGLIYKEGRSELLLDTFLGLYIPTRRRHQAPPQPRRWFENLILCFGEAMKIRVALKAGKAVAAIVTLRHNGTLLYKYGCSDPLSNNLGGTHLLLWRSIGEAKQEGLHTFDLGRSDPQNTGLVTFKDRWNATRSVLAYSRYTSSEHSPGNYKSSTGWKIRIAKKLVSHLPGAMFSSVGDFLYKHIG